MAGPKKRHGCLTAWLGLMIVVNALTALAYLLGSSMMRQAMPNAPAWAFPVLIVFAVINVVCAVALFQWKKWGFWGVCVSSAAGLVVNLSIGLSIGSVVLGLVGVAILYGILQIGGDNKGWPQLE